MKKCERIETKFCTKETSKVTKAIQQFFFFSSTANQRVIRKQQPIYPNDTDISRQLEKLMSDKDLEDSRVFKDNNIGRVKAVAKTVMFKDFQVRSVWPLMKLIHNVK